jgi:hypothetical protein
MSKRAERRHHIERLKDKRKSFYDGWGRSSSKVIGKLVHTACLCSCEMCRNPRKREGLTFQERRAIQEEE